MGTAPYQLYAELYHLAQANALGLIGPLVDGCFAGISTVDKIPSNFSFGQEHFVSYIAFAKRDSMISFFVLEGIDLSWTTDTERYGMRKDGGPKTI